MGLSKFNIYLHFLQLYLPPLINIFFYYYYFYGFLRLAAKERCLPVIQLPRNDFSQHAKCKHCRLPELGICFDSLCWGFPRTVSYTSCLVYSANVIFKKVNRASSSLKTRWKRAVWWWCSCKMDAGTGCELAHVCWHCWQTCPRNESEVLQEFVILKCLAPGGVDRLCTSEHVSTPARDARARAAWKSRRWGQEEHRVTGMLRW